MKKSIVLKVSKPEFDAILTGLRVLQHALVCGMMPDALYEVLWDSGTALDIGQIDKLCERINS